MLDKPGTGFRVKIVSIRRKVKGSELHIKDIGEEGTVTDWIDKPGWEVWIPKIDLNNGTVCYGDKIWWKRVS